MLETADCGDYVVAVGCHDIHTTGKKRFQKKYYSHSTRPGSLKEITMDRMIAKFGGAEVLRKAVSGMLPKNRLRDVRLARLKGSLIPFYILLLVFRSWRVCLRKQDLLIWNFLQSI